MVSVVPSLRETGTSRLPLKLTVALAVESLIEQPASMSHASYDPAARAAFGITDELIRISVGLEDYDDLQADLEQALG